MSQSSLTAEELKRMYIKMLKIRKHEQKANELFMMGLIPGTIHLYLGEEACSAGVTENLTDRDTVFLTHRPHGGAIAKGMPPRELLAELLGRAGGCARGRGGSMHLIDSKRGVYPTIPIIGAGMAMANGVALAEKQNGTGNIAVSFFGDGCSNIGTFHESLNMAAVLNLPVVFVCENNLYAVSTKITYSCKLENIADRAKAYGIPSTVVDGNDVEAVYFAAKEAVEKARSGNGPTLIECKTYRQCGHSRTDAAPYRTKEELNSWLERDPLKLCREKLISLGYADEQECNSMEDEVQKLIDEAAEYAKTSPMPDPKWALDYVYAE